MPYNHAPNPEATMTTTPPSPSATAAELREWITDLAAELPEAEVTSQTGQHDKLTVRGRTFAYFLVDHHGDGRVALSVKGAPGVREALTAGGSPRYFVPAYSSRGWFGLDLQAPGTDLEEVRHYLRESYCLVAPKTLAAQVG